MLPVPYDQQLTPIYSYPQNNPPVVPSIQVHPEGAQLLVSAAAFCANAVGDAAPTSTTRMFCYNLMSVNNWNNKDFFDFVRLVVDYTVFKKLTGTASAANIYVTLQQVANEFASLYASYMAHSYQEYFVLLDPPTQNRVIQNINIFNEFASHADSVYGAQNIQTAQAPMHHQHMGNMPSSLNMGMRPMQHMARPMVGAGQQHRFPQHMPGNSGVNPAVSGLSPVTGHSVQRDSFVTTKFSSIPAKSTFNNQSNQTTQGGPVKSNLHEIAYRGHHVVHGRAQPQKVTPAPNKTEQGKAPPKINIATGEIKDVVQISDLAFTTALQTIEANVSSKLKHGEFMLFPYEVKLWTPIISSVDTGNLFELLQSCNTFAKVSEIMQAYRAKLDEIIETDPAGYYFGKIWLEKVDRFITNHVNEYFLKAMPEGGFNITSMMEDGGDIQTYASTTYATRANPAFTTYQRMVMSCMFEADSHGEFKLPDLEEPENSAVDYSIMTTRCMVTVISATADALDYNITRQPTKVTRDSMGVLFDLLFQLNKTAKQAMATKNYLLTLDGKKWVFWESAVSANEFSIYEE